MIYSFPALVRIETEILILGTMPGAASLQKQEYYGNPRNHFWKITYEVLGCLPIAATYNQKMELLLRNKIGLWDVLQACERRGSLDSAIKNYLENDFESFFKTYPNIKTIVFNGKDSQKYFIKKFGQINGITYHVMPSTSPANTMSFENKLKMWSTCLLQVTNIFPEKCSNGVFDVPT